MKRKTIRRMKKILTFLIFLLLSAVVMAQSVDGALKTLTASGTNTYTITDAFPAAYNSKERFLVRFTNANTGAATLNRSSLGAKDIKKAGNVALSAGDIQAGGTYLLSYNGTYYQIIGDGGSGGTGGSDSFVFSSTAPTSTNVAWVDTGNSSMGASPIRRYINGAWTPVTDECDWWDSVGGVISKGKPIAILFSGQSNVGHSSYFPLGETYTGDITVNNHVALWQPTTDEWEVFDGTSATAGNRTWSYPSGGGTLNATDDLFGTGLTNQLWVFGKLYAKTFNRSVRFVGTRRGGQPMAQWEATKLAWTELIAIATEASVPRYDAFIWIHGEAGLSNADNPSSFSTYKDSFYDFIGRLRSQSWADEKLKIIMPSHQLNDLAAFTGAQNATVLSPLGDVGAEGTARSLDNQDSPYSGWAATAYAREAQQGGPDPFHMTTREQERQGMAIYQTYLSLPNYKKGDRLYRVFYTNTSNRLTSVKAVIPNTNDFEILHNGGNSSTSTFVRSFSATGTSSYIADIQEVVSGLGANYVKWAIRSSSTTPGTLEDKISVASTGVTVPKLLNITGTNTATSDPSSALVFLNGGGTINDGWIGRDASSSFGMIYKSGIGGGLTGRHKFFIGDDEIFLLYYRTASRLAADLNFADLRITNAGSGIWIKEGSNARMGTATLSAGTVTVSNTSITANTRIFLTVQSLGTVTSPKAIAVTARVNGTSFTITSADVTDTSVVAWELKEGF